jgi:hypothetical protein
VSITIRRALLALPLAILSLSGRPVEAAPSADFATTEAMRPEYVINLEASFGPPSRNGFGSSVLFAMARDRDELERLSRVAYQYFAGSLWERRGEAAWMGSWHLLHERTAIRDIAAELSDLDEPQAKSSADMLLNAVESPNIGKAALSAAFDDPAILDMLVFNIGDGAAMSGLLIAARRSKGEAVFLLFLMD